MKYVISIMNPKEYYLADYSSWKDDDKDIPWDTAWKKDIKNSKFVDLVTAKRQIKVIKSVFYGNAKHTLKINIYK